ncbi:DUF2057 family protein [Moraxella sp. Pampa]|uniref:DUF2057 family protein n=1 Tax=Moraxella sp. Pampa TaxID=3111978 RepID=UPI002B40FF2E|nr:DUF2057 family protein [Moraxella sp. Pampa]
MKKIAICIATLLMGISVHAEVHLLIDDNIKVIAINSQEIRHGVLQPLQRDFKLQAGRHIITARYDRMFDLSRGEHDYLKSDHVTITADLKDNQTYQLVMPNQPNNYKSAKAYIKAPALAIIQNGQVISKENSTAERQESILKGLTQSIGSIFNHSDNTASSDQKANTIINQDLITTPSQEQHQQPMTQSNLDGFTQLWLNASEEEQEKIRQWIGK